MPCWRERFGRPGFVKPNLTTSTDTDTTVALLRHRQTGSRWFDVLKPFDYPVFLLAVGAIVFPFILLSPKGGAPEVDIHTATKEYVYPLHTNQTLTVNGPIGKTVIEMNGGRVRVLEDPGPKQICVLQGWIENSGQWLACLPNKVLINIEGKRVKSSVDDVSF